MSTFKEAAIKALHEVDNEPKTAKELWEIIDEKGWKQSNGKTPWSTLHETMGVHSDKKWESTPAGKDIIFERLEERTPDEFRLITEDHEQVVEEEDQSEPQKEEAPVSRMLEVTSEEINWQKIRVVDNNGNLEYTVEEPQAYTYMMLDGRGEKVKIGRTTRTPTKRLKQFQTPSPGMNVEVAFPESRYSESYLHERFDNEIYRESRELFFYTKKIRTFVEKEQNLIEKVLDRYEYEQKIQSLDEEIINLL